MLQRLVTLTALVAAAASLSDAVKVHIKVHHPQGHRDNTVSTSSGDHLKPVVTIQARVQGDTPVWDEEKEEWTGSFGETFDDKYRSVLDTVNTASVEGALMYVQAEGINQREQSVKCERKNKMKNIVFYEITTVQPTAAVNYYANKHPVLGYCPFVAMDGGKCTDAGSDIPDTCKQFDGLDSLPKLGHCVGANEQSSDLRAPYPNNYWYSYPNSCVAKKWADKTDECRQEYAGGLCPHGEKPDGEKCTYSYKILGYVSIDDVVGITDATRMPDGKAYSNFTEFCQAGGVEFDAVNTGKGFEVKQSLPFWENPADSQANSKRADILVETYNKVANATSSNMSPLPTVTNLTTTNPPCYESTPECVNAKYGCMRTLYSQMCVPCLKHASGCAQPESTEFVFPGSK